MSEPFRWHLSPYRKFIPEALRQRLWADAEPVPAVAGLRVAAGLRARFPDTLTDAALGLLAEVYAEIRFELQAVLLQRETDRAFIDQQTLTVQAANAGKSIEDADYATAIGAETPWGTVPFGPAAEPAPLAPVDVPGWLAGPQVTLFGPPDTAPMAVNAMNAWHRKPADEPEVVTRLVEAGGHVPRWGADDEDSKTPLMASFLAATENLQGCFDGTLRHEDPAKGKTYALAAHHLALPIKRIPGLALPDGSHLLDGQPLPLHLVDFVLHCWHTRHLPKARVFYIPKLETPAEAAYLRRLIEATDRAVRALDPGCEPALVRTLLVFENPRAIFQIRELAAALGPHFLGGSLGWHDFLASTARLFQYDPNYRIPVKADPDIVINRICESHRILVRSLAGTGALTIGGMYGVLPMPGDARSQAVSLVGFVRDVTTQLKRGLTGFWVAHPDFVRPGLALVEAWARHLDGDATDLRHLVSALVPDPAELVPLLDFVFGPDVPGLDPSDPRYTRSVLAADLACSPVIANDHPDEVRYNVFQALQYLTDWLKGNGCVALPAHLGAADGSPVPVRIMDDLATTERSRRELWAEVRHGRVPAEDFERILAEELAFIRGDGPDRKGGRQVQVGWDETWSPVAGKLLHALVCTKQPPEFVTELALPFTFPQVREAADPWDAALAFRRG